MGSLAFMRLVVARPQPNKCCKRSGSRSRRASSCLLRYRSISFKLSRRIMAAAGDAASAVACGGL